MSVLQPWMPAQASPEVPVNENFIALEHLAVYAKDATTTAGLSWGYLGGRWSGFAIMAGVLALTASATNYIVVERATGAISVSIADSHWGDIVHFARVYKLTVGAATVTDIEDWRAGSGGVHGLGVTTGDLGVVLEGLDVEVPPDPIVASDNILEAFGKLQSQINAGGGGGVSGNSTINLVVNSRFAINPRGYVSGAATAAGEFTFTQWKVTGAAGLAYATLNNKTTVTIPAGQTLQQTIEGLNIQPGRYVLSWEGTAQGRIATGDYGASGAVVADLVGGVNTVIEFNAGTLTNVKLEPGAVATAYTPLPYPEDDRICQRYLPYFKANSSVDPISQSWATSANSAFCEMALSSRTRVPVTGILVSSAGDFKVFSSTGIGIVLSSLTYNAAGFSAVRLIADVSGGLTQGTSGSFAAHSANAKIIFTGAEI